MSRRNLFNLLLGGSKPGFLGVSIAHQVFAPDGTDLSAMVGTNITGWDTDESDHANPFLADFGGLTMLGNGDQGVARSQNGVRAIQPIGLVLDVGRAGVDSAGQYIRALVFADSVIALSSLIGVSPPTIDGIGLSIGRNNSGSVVVDFYQQAPGAGAPTLTALIGVAPLPISGGTRFVLIVQNGMATGWQEDFGGGGPKTMFTPVVVVGDWNDGTHDRLYFEQNTGATNAGRFWMGGAGGVDWQR